MKKTAVFLMLATAAVLPGCKSQETAEDIKTTEEMTADVQNNPLMKKSGNKHGIESFDKITTNDYRTAANAGMRKEKERINAIVTNTAAPNSWNIVSTLSMDWSAGRSADGGVMLHTLTTIGSTRLSPSYCCPRNDVHHAPAPLPSRG